MAEQKVDVITMSLINNSLASLIDEMDMTIVRTTTSPPQRDTYDFLCSLTNAEGEVLMEGEEAVLHPNLCDPVIHDLLKNRGIDYVHPDDMFCINDPFSGASHFPDVMVLHPVFYNDQLVAWTSAGGHVLDIGGRVAGSCDCLSRTSPTASNTISSFQNFWYTSFLNSSRSFDCHIIQTANQPWLYI